MGSFKRVKDEVKRQVHDSMSGPKLKGNSYI